MSSDKFAITGSHDTFNLEIPYDNKGNNILIATNMTIPSFYGGISNLRGSNTNCIYMGSTGNIGFSCGKIIPILPKYVDGFYWNPIIGLKINPLDIYNNSPNASFPTVTWNLLHFRFEF